MTAILYAIVTVLFWGSWLAPIQSIPFKNQQIKIFYVSVANLILTVIVTLFQNSGRLPFEVFWLPFAGGVIWAVSGLCAFTGTSKIGMARAFGIWAPLNIIISIIWGAVFFNELVGTTHLGLFMLVASILIIIAGALMIIFAKGWGEGSSDRKSWIVGLLGALGAGVLWGTYLIPIKLAGVSMWAVTFPMAVGIFAGSTVLVLLTRESIILAKTAYYMRVGIGGVMWGIGNYAMLLLVGQLGAGRGFTISQLAVVVNGLIGVFILKDPQPKTQAATLTLIGCALATVGGIILGNL